MGAAFLATVLAGIVPDAARAQSSGNGYFFRQPSVTANFQIGFAQPDASGDLFTDLADVFTLEARDFHSVDLSFGLNYHIGSRVAIGGSIGYSGRTVESEYRNFDETVGGDSIPIEQSTRFTRVPYMVQARFYLIPTGRQIGSFAWIPNRASTYIGVGAGGMHYIFRQRGDFITEDESDIRTGTFEGLGWAPAGQLFGGFEHGATSRLLVTGEVNYTQASRKLPRDFDVGYDSTDLLGVAAGNEPLDLSGIAVKLGLSLRM
jgi:hypothetical protein